MGWSSMSGPFPRVNDCDFDRVSRDSGMTLSAWLLDLHPLIYRATEEAQLRGSVAVSVQHFQEPRRMIRSGWDGHGWYVAIGGE